MADDIDWAKLRARIAETPVVVKPKHIKHPNRSPESIEKRKIGARARNKKRYWANRDECLAENRAWEKANPEKVKAHIPELVDALEYLAEDYEHPNGFNLINALNNQLKTE